MRIDLQRLVDMWVETAIEDFLDEMEDLGYPDEEIGKALLFHNQFWTAWKNRTTDA